jgi:hypothetical protein
MDVQPPGPDSGRPTDVVMLDCGLTPTVPGARPGATRTWEPRDHISALIRRLDPCATGSRTSATPFGIPRRSQDERRRLVVSGAAGTVQTRPGVLSPRGRRLAVRTAGPVGQAAAGGAVHCIRSLRT